MSPDRPKRQALSDLQRDRLRIVREHLPELVVESVSATFGQFNDVLILNDEVIVRFPRSDDAAKVLAVEIAVLRALQGRVPIPVPSSLISALEDDVRRPPFMGYRMLPGLPLDRMTLDELWQFDRPVIERLGQQAGAFLRVLHTLPVDSFGFDVPLSDDGPFWRRMLDAFRDELFGFMRSDARATVEREFHEYLSDPDNFTWRAVLRHGDFGGPNLLFDAESQRLSGVIDFGSVAFGDPAVDFAAISAFDQRLAHAMLPVYPELFTPDVLRRARFYQCTFAMQQALWALRAGDEAEFDDGIAAYV